MTNFKFTDSWTGWRRVKKVFKQKKILFDNLIEILKFVPYKLPKFEKAFNAKDRLCFGKYSDRTYKDIRQNEKGYCNWILQQRSYGRVLNRFQSYLKNPKEMKEVYQRAEYDYNAMDDLGIKYKCEYEDRYKYDLIIKIYRLLCYKPIQLHPLIRKENRHRKAIERRNFGDLDRYHKCFKDFITKDRNYKIKVNYRRHVWDSIPSNHYVINEYDVTFMNEFLATMPHRYHKDYLKKYIICEPTTYD
jgi:hypothetical protein